MTTPELAEAPLSADVAPWPWTREALGRLRHAATAHPAVAAVCGLSPVVLLAWTLSDARSPAQYPIDLIPTYVAGRVWLEHHPEAVYHGGAWMPQQGFAQAWVQTVASSGVRLPDTAFVYSPVYLALMLPLIALTTAQQFFWAFGVLNAACAVLVGLRCAALAQLQGERRTLLLALAVALSFPASYAALLGQNVLPTAALLLYGFDAVEKGQRRGVLLLLFASAFKPWAAASLGVLLIGRKYRAFSQAFLAHTLVFIVVPHLLFPKALMVGYQTALTNLTSTNVLAFNSIGLRALVQRLILPDWTVHATQWARHGQVSLPHLVVEGALSLALGALLCWRVWTRPPPFTTLYTCCMALILGVLGTVWSHYLVFALPVLCVGLFRPHGPAVRWLAAAGAFWVLAMMSAGVPPNDWLRPRWTWAVIYSGPLLIALAVAWLQLWGADSSAVGGNRQVANSVKSASRAKS